MTFYLKPLPAYASELRDWPPLRVYINDTGTQWLSVADLVYLEGELNYTWLHWADGRRVLVTTTLKRVEAQLPPAYFLRLHRRYVVNRQFIEQARLTFGKPIVHLVGGLHLPIARRRWMVLRSQFTLR
ncbi:response regulator receiver protein [Spirosoma sp. HMF4905]|uniref:Response regulator receiver protein n=1 Tax=Spirosoma arboris TaxID=2682092 RepID=A0A7K1S484_9BACT|nr:LytTR family DNA-binding domain-containing protein [Spirosoma arboris]MVM28416.1 response regulator receiver protein [Spirosoma arboris]